MGKGSIVVVGTIGIDEVETPFARRQGLLGGSAAYFSTAAALYAPVHLVGVVGEDFPEDYRQQFVARGVDLAGLQTLAGKTFRWGGRYHYDLNSRDTLYTELNVLTEFRPCLPEHCRQADFLFLANVDPELQLEVLRQVQRPRLVMLDSMNYWIEQKRQALDAAIAAVDVVRLNDEEVRQYCGTPSLVKAARRLLAQGPRWLIVTKGEHGAALFADGAYFVAPAYPLEEVVDPTGAGDSFAGGLLGYLAYTGDLSLAGMRRALIHGSVVASFAVEDFGLGRLAQVTPQDVAQRYAEFREFTTFDVVVP